MHIADLSLCKHCKYTLQTEAGKAGQKGRLRFFCCSNTFAKSSATIKSKKHRATLLTAHRVVGPACHIPHHHVGDGQDLPIFGLLNEDGHAARHQLAVVLYALCSGDELPI